MIFKYSILNLLVAVFLFCQCQKGGNDQIESKPTLNNNYILEVTGNNSMGWGYRIYKGNKLIIDQKVIPAIAGIRRFKTEEEAKIIGDLVIKKMRTDGDFPSITILELDSLKIIY